MEDFIQCFYFHLDTFNLLNSKNPEDMKGLEYIKQKDVAC